MAKVIMTKFIVYSLGNDVIVTTKKNEAETIRKICENSKSNLEDYERQEIDSYAVTVRLLD
jgi:coenzyme F420-reducing hydrogenase beta subunit